MILFIWKCNLFSKQFSQQSSLILLLELSLRVQLAARLFLKVSLVTGFHHLISDENLKQQFQCENVLNIQWPPDLRYSMMEDITDSVNVRA